MSYARVFLLAAAVLVAQPRGVVAATVLASPISFKASSDSITCTIVNLGAKDLSALIEVVNSLLAPS